MRQRLQAQMCTVCPSESILQRHLSVQSHYSRLKPLLKCFVIQFTLSYAYPLPGNLVVKSL